MSVKKISYLAGIHCELCNDVGLDVMGRTKQHNDLTWWRMKCNSCHHAAWYGISPNIKPSRMSDDEMARIQAEVFRNPPTYYVMDRPPKRGLDGNTANLQQARKYP